MISDPFNIRPVPQLIIIFILLLLAGCGPASTGSVVGGPERDLIIFHAGSLTVPVKELSAKFQELYPNVRVLTEAAGSIITARKVSELGREADLVMSADYQVINNLLIPDHAPWNILFARNSMVVTYTENSAYADQINIENWYQILLREDTTVGRSNPLADPNGYRTLMVWQLAENYYNLPGLAEDLELASPPQYIRPKETDLIPLLLSRDLDYAYNYLSVAVQHNLRYIELPGEINLSNPDYRDLYRSAVVYLDGEKPGDLIVRHGEPIIYGVTIPVSAPNPEAAELFLKFLLSPRGMEILEVQGQIPMDPPLSSSWEQLPENLKEFVNPLEIE
jgi:molybdate/tungstate transport system substrate-binding protein